MPPLGYRYDPELRFFAKVEQRHDGCWIWTGARNHRGYGWFGRGGRQGGSGLAHRWAYEHFVGPVPPGLELDHICLNAACVNPEHLEPVTGDENRQRAYRAGRTRGPTRHPQTHCRHGHPLDSRRRDGGRYCKTCNRIRARENHKRRPRLTAALRGGAIERDGLVCQLCGGMVEPRDVHIDHVIPLCRGGQNVLANLQVTHSWCNIRKSARVLRERR